MDRYKKPYHHLWTSCSAAIDALERQNFGLAREILLRALQDGDELLAQQSVQTSKDE